MLDLEQMKTTVFEGTRNIEETTLSHLIVLVMRTRLDPFPEDILMTEEAEKQKTYKTLEQMEPKVWLS